MRKEKEEKRTSKTHKTTEKDDQINKNQQIKQKITKIRPTVSRISNIDKVDRSSPFLTANHARCSNSSMIVFSVTVIDGFSLKPKPKRKPAQTMHKPQQPKLGQLQGPQNFFFTHRQTIKSALNQSCQTPQRWPRDSIITELVPIAPQKSGCSIIFITFPHFSSQIHPFALPLSLRPTQNLTGHPNPFSFSLETRPILQSAVSY